MKLTINNREIELTEEEFEEIASQLLSGGFYISNISYNFGNDKTFTEEMTIVGNLELTRKTKEHLSNEGIEFIEEFIKPDWNYDESS